jgi:hypothetical protein
MLCRNDLAGLNGEIGLPQGDDLFAWVAILNNQITGITGKFEINICIL